MSGATKKEAVYQGFEQGPIRPPSEAHSLLIRVTRNCPWNRCSFCPVYKNERFSLRPVAHVKEDIDAVYRHIQALREMSDSNDRIDRSRIAAYQAGLAPFEAQAFYAALNWFACGMRSIFLQDANSLIIKPKDLVEILTHLKQRFPRADRVTSYARSHTVARIKDADLKAMADAGLNRIHIGLESGSDEVLERMKKGVDKQTHITAGQKVKRAGMELSEYVMPGLGGRELSRVHALETADALNQINPDFIRLRTLAIPNTVPLFEAYASGEFEKLTDRMAAQEILLFLESLSGIESYLKSDHILNLFEEIEGKLPEDQPQMTGVIKTFLNMDPHRQMLYQVGRRLGLFSRLSDLNDPQLAARAEAACRSYGITPDNVDTVIDEIMKRFI